MSIQLSEFQRVNGGDDDLLPMYVTKKEPNKNLHDNNENNNNLITSNKPRKHVENIYYF